MITALILTLVFIAAIVFVCYLDEQKPYPEEWPTEVPDVEEDEKVDDEKTK